MTNGGRCKTATEPGIFFNLNSGKVINNTGGMTNGSPYSQWTAGTSSNLKFNLLPQ